MQHLQRLWLWIKAYRTPLLATLAGLGVSFALLGLPGFASYWPAERLFIWAGDGALLTQIKGDALWPVLISASFLQALLITPAHWLVHRQWPQLPLWAHIALMALAIWLVCVLATSMMLLAQVGH